MAKRLIDTEDDIEQRRAAEAEAKAKRKADLQTARYVKACGALARWQRRQKVANNKVRALKRRVAYYSKELAK